MENFEKLGAFYLGRPYELGTKTPKDGILLYDSKDLLTHAVCVGMTGSGKTGVAAVDEQMNDLDAQFKAETTALDAASDPQTETLETTVVKPTKANITIKLLSLAWAPYWQDAQGQTTPAWE